ncbi:MAG: hypothetical protein JOZ35_11605 [Hyphomicrobiales bacterium]|nr:hypothetical protein [Hyphomicrobiales bacterium]
MTMTPNITLHAAMADPKLFGTVFGSASFWPWKTIAKLIDGIPLTEPREVELLKGCTGRTALPTEPVRRLIMLAGRRAGKDRFFSAAAVWRAALCTDWRQHQSAGEGAVVILLGADKKQANILRKYCEGLLRTPLLAAEVVRSTGEVTEFRNGASLEIATNDARLVRGRSAIAVLGSECCHWKTDEHAASSDEEVVGAAEPSMAMCPDGGLLLLGSSVHRKRGYMFRKWKELYGNDESESICWFAPSSVMNPKLPVHVVDRALAEDVHKARAEYLNIWREDLAEFLPIDVVESCTDWDVHEHAPKPDTKYVAYVDAASGTGKDSYALAIAHIEPDGSMWIDVVRERKPRFVPAQVIAEYSELLATYHVTEVHSDNYAAGFHSSEWSNHPTPFLPCKDSTSDNYLGALPVLLARRAHLLDNTTLRNQLTSLERTVGAGDKETVTHPKHANAHDDVAAAVCGAIMTALQAAKRAALEPKIVVPFFAGTPRNIPGGSAYQYEPVAGPIVPSAAPLPAASPPPDKPPAEYTPEEREWNRQRINNDKSIEYRIMGTRPREPWRDYVNTDGSIRSRPRGRWDI